MKQSQINALNILGNIEPDTTADLLEKAMGHKYYKREGTPGNYKYYYTEEEYNKAKGKKTEDKKDKQSSPETIEKDGKNYKLQPNGKYLEVSEHGLTKEQHEAKRRKYLIDEDYARDAHIEAYSKRYPYADHLHKEHMEAMKNRVLHQDTAKKLSDKEFTKEELEDKKENKGKKTEGVLYEMGEKVKFFDNGRNKNFKGVIKDYKEAGGKVTYSIKIDGRTDIVEGVSQKDIGKKM